MGSECEIGNRKLEKFGSEIKLTDAEALNALEGGAALCPDKDFRFTAEEIKKYPYAKFRDRAPDEFKERFKVAAIAIHAHLEALKAAAEPVAPQENVNV